MRLGVFGGEFDPPHNGHVAVARAARRQLQLDRLLVMPTGSPPHRPAGPRPAEVRHRLAAAAFAGEPGVEVSRLELDRPGPSFTVDTLARLASAGELFLIVGADQLAGFGGWRRPEAIRRLATLVVAPRPGLAVDDPVAVVLEMEPVDLSSTELRAALAQGRSIEQLVPAAVAELIAREGLYRAGSC